MRPTDHERNARVFALFAQGMTDREIAAKFSISPQRVGQLRRRLIALLSSKHRRFSGIRVIPS